MYTIKQASIRTGVSIPLLRAWERRYGIPRPARTPSGYRLYDESALSRVRAMRGLVESGWAPSQAARAVLDAPAPDAPAIPGEEASIRPGREAPIAAVAETAPSRASAPRARVDEAGRIDLPEADRQPRFDTPVRRFVEAARAYDERALDAVMGEAFAALGVESALEDVVLPALAEVGQAWSEGALDVAAEHAATGAVQRRLGALYEAAGTPSSTARVIVGMPPGARHELGALAFAVAARRAGLHVLYLGADVPEESWVAALRERPGAAAVLGAVTMADADSAAAVAGRLRERWPDAPVCVGGAAKDRVVAASGPAVFALPNGLRAAVAAVRQRIGT